MAKRNRYRWQHEKHRDVPVHPVKYRYTAGSPAVWTEKQRELIERLSAEVGAPVPSVLDKKQASGVIDALISRKKNRIVARAGTLRKDVLF